jgi:hypothetical protein
LPTASHALMVKCSQRTAARTLIQLIHTQKTARNFTYAVTGFSRSWGAVPLGQFTLRGISSVRIQRVCLDVRNGSMMRIKSYFWKKKKKVSIFGFITRLKAVFRSRTWEKCYRDSRTGLGSKLKWTGLSYTTTNSFVSTSFTLSSHSNKEQRQ